MNMASFCLVRKKVDFAAVGKEKLTTIIARRKKVNCAVVSKEKSVHVVDGTKEKSGFCSSS